MNRQYIFRNYWWIALVAGGFFASMAFLFGGEDRVGFVGASIAGALGFCYFVQQQKLAETHLFHSLFTSFNQRYDRFNGPLTDIAEGTSALSPQEQRNVVVDYFNLCAEEYLFYKEGYIHDDAWRSWCRGMAWYLKRHPFRDIWNDEVNRNPSTDCR